MTGQVPFELFELVACLRGFLHASVPRCLGTMCLEGAALAPPEWYHRARGNSGHPETRDGASVIPETQEDLPIAEGWTLHS